MSKFSVILSSANRASGSINDATFNFNWNAMPEGKYKMGFTFYSAYGSIPASNEGLFIAIKNLGCVLPTYTVAPTDLSMNTGAYGYNVLGYVSPWASGAINYLYAEHQSNCPLLIYNKPTSNQFTVSLYKQNLTTVATLDLNWTLTLNFEPVEGEHFNLR